MDIKILKDLFQVTIERRNLCNRHNQVIRKRIVVNLGSSQEWKSGAVEPDRSGKPKEMSWYTLQKVDPHREEPLLGRNAHSVRYGELIRDLERGNLSQVNYQEEAEFRNFRHGVVTQQNFVNKVKDQVRNRQKRMSNVAESGDDSIQ